MNNNFPFNQDNIKDPVPKQMNPAKIQNILFKDTNYMREARLQSALDKQPLQKTNDYSIISNNLINYKIPSNSTDLLDKIDYNTLKKSFTKEEFDNKYIHEIHNMMLPKNTENISKETLDNIQGIVPQEKSTDKSIILPYKPLYNMIDVSTYDIHHMFQVNAFDYKFTGYDSTISKWKDF